jgi:hypothetical protein
MGKKKIKKSRLQGIFSEKTQKKGAEFNQLPLFIFDIVYAFFLPTTSWEASAAISLFIKSTTTGVAI